MSIESKTTNMHNRLLVRNLHFRLQRKITRVRDKLYQIPDSKKPFFQSYRKALKNKEKELEALVVDSIDVFCEVEGLLKGRFLEFLQDGSDNPSAKQERVVLLSYIKAMSYLNSAMQFMQLDLYQIISRSLQRSLQQTITDPSVPCRVDYRYLYEEATAMMCRELEKFKRKPAEYIASRRKQGGGENKAEIVEIGKKYCWSEESPEITFSAPFDSDSLN